MNSQAVFAKKTGMIILGGGLVKHHIANANLMVRTLGLFILMTSHLGLFLFRLVVFRDSPFLLGALPEKRS